VTSASQGNRNPTLRNEVSAHKMLEAMVGGILESGSRAVLDGSFYEEIALYVEHETVAVVSPEELIRGVCRPGESRLLDFGCGVGAYRPMLEGFGYEWHGVNYRDGMAVAAAEAAETAADSRMTFYDGGRLEFPDQTFDAVYSFQTFEHIQSIPTTFAEICRVLKPGGSLIGTVSCLEQIHDYSTFNFTPYGLKLASQQAGLTLVKLYPRCDAFTFLLRRLLVVTSGSDDNSLSSSLRTDNAIGQEFVAFGKRLGLTPTEINLLRLMFSVHVAFHIVRPIAADVVPVTYTASRAEPIGATDYASAARWVPSGG
jgi:SAM-dependent methyltransferase